MTDLWDDDEDFEEAPKPKGKNPLRDVVKDLEAKLKERDDELKTLRPQVRSTAVSNVFAKLGVDTKYARLVPSDLDATEDSLKAWAEEFGFAPTAPGEGSTDTTPGQSAEGVADVDPVAAAQAAQWQRIQTQSSATGTTSPDIESQQIAMLQAAEKAANGNTDLLFAMLRGDAPIPS